MDNRPSGSEQPDEQKGVTNEELMMMLQLLVEIERRNARNRRGGSSAKALIAGMGIKEIATKVRDAIGDAF